MAAQPNGKPWSCAPVEMVESLEDIYRRWDDIVAAEDFPVFKQMLLRLVELAPDSVRGFDKSMLRLRREFKRADARRSKQEQA